jgi:hypothetical protein
MDATFLAERDNYTPTHNSSPEPRSFFHTPIFSSQWEQTTKMRLPWRMLLP